VRVARPEDLAMYVLGGDPSWDRRRLATAMNGSRPSFHTLPDPVRVHLVYLTSWVDDTGAVQFRPDVYKLDTRLASALDGRPRTMPFPT
jgi:L,D-transpeptidase YcbB